MISVKTELGYKLPDKIFYKQNGKYLQVKKIFANQSQLEGMTICSCEADLSNYLKLLYQMYQLNQDLLPYLEEGVEKNDIINQQSDLESEIQSTLIEQIELNKQLTIIKNAIHLKRVVYPAAQAVESLTAHMIKDITGVVIKITPGAVDINPDVVFGSLLGNGYFKYEGSWYKLSTTSTQDDDILSIQDKFGGETKVVTEIIAGNTLINYIRKQLKRSVEDNLTSLDKIITQQNLIDGMIIDRQAEILSGTSTITPNTDKFLELFYNVPTINDITPTNHNAVTLRANVALRRSNIQVGTTIDVLNPVVIPNLPSLKNKASQILGHLALAVSLPITDSGIDNPNVQIYSSSDIHEFKFKYMGRLNTGVHFDQIEGTLLQTLQHSRISSNINLGTLKDLSTMKLAKLTSEDVNVVPNIISEVSDKIDNIIESVKLGSGVTPITTLINPISTTKDATWSTVSTATNYSVSVDANKTITVDGGTGYSEWFSSLWNMKNTGRTGKVYFEIERIPGGMGLLQVGIQRVPTRVGNYGVKGYIGDEQGTRNNGGTAIFFEPSSTGYYNCVVDLDRSELIVNGVSSGILSGSGDIYLGVYNTNTWADVTLKIYTTSSTCKNNKPSGVSYWSDSYNTVLNETDSHSRIITNTTDSLLTITPTVSITGFNAEIVSESSNIIEVLPEIVQPTAQTKYIISPVSTVINPITENAKTTAGVSYSAQDLYYQANDIFRDNSTLAYYPLDGNANDALGLHNATATNVTYSTGKFGQGVVFDGTNTRVVKTGTIPNAQSVSMWVYNPTEAVSGTTNSKSIGRLTSNHNWDCVVIGDITGGSNAETFGLVVDSQIVFMTSQTIPQGWLHFAISFNPTTKLWSVFMNGVAVNNNLANGAVSSIPVFDIWMGRREYGDAVTFTGQWDQVRVFNRQLTQADATILYTETSMNPSTFIRRVEGFRETDLHSRIISKVSDTPATIQEFDVVTTQAHTRVVSLIGSNIYTIEDVTATATAHPQLSTPSSDVINLMSDRKVKLTSSIIPIITNTDSPINPVVENVKVVNDPIPFTVYQQSVGVVKQFDKPIMEPSSIDIYVSSVKNIGAMSRIDPITVTVDKIPNYISTQTNMSDVLTYSDSVEYIKTIENYVVSQVTDVYSPQVFDKPTIVAEPFELFVTESKSMNTATFGDIIDVLMLPSDSYIVSRVSNNTATFGDVLDCINTPHDSDAIIDVKSVKSVTFDNSVLVLNTDSVDKVIDIKSIKTITFDNSVLELSTDRMDKVIDIKAVKSVSFDNNVDMTLNSEGSAFIISNGLVYSASDVNDVLVVADTVDGKHYAIVRDETGIIESYETDLPITSNNYFYDSVASVMYKVTSTSGFIDLVAM